MGSLLDRFLKNDFVHRTIQVTAWITGQKRRGDGIVARSLYSLADSDEEKDEKKDDE